MIDFIDSGERLDQPKNKACNKEMSVVFYCINTTYTVCVTIKASEKMNDACQLNKIDTHVENCLGMISIIFMNKTDYTSAACCKLLPA